MNSEILTTIKSKKDGLDKKIIKLTNDINISNIKHTSLMRAILSDKFSRIKEVIINRDSITFQVRSDDERYTHDVTVSNNDMSYSNTFTYNPKIQWNSGSAKRESTTMISYINVVAFIAGEFSNSESDFSKLMESAWSSVFTMNMELSTLKSELSRTVRDIQNEELRLKREAFYNTLKAGNYYYKVRSNYGRNFIYDIVHIDKINPKTIAIRMTCSNGDSNTFDAFDNNRISGNRIRPHQLFSMLQDFTLMDRGKFTEIVLDNKFKGGIDYIRRQKGLTSVMDIKVLCQNLLEFGVTSEKVPTNDILHYISKWRHYTLQNNRV